jgi:hypothetical protein
MRFAVELNRLLHERNRTTLGGHPTARGCERHPYANHRNTDSTNRHSVVTHRPGAADHRHDTDNNCHGATQHRHRDGSNRYGQGFNGAAMQTSLLLNWERCSAQSLFPTAA